MPFPARSYRDADRWTPRHFADELREVPDARERARVANVHQPAASPTSAAVAPQSPAPIRVVRCDCGRTVRPEVLVDVRALPASVRGAQEWACDSCWTRWIREQRLTVEKWLTHLGAPTAIVTAARERARARPGRAYLP